jgi:hypothetical protein
MKFEYNVHLKECVEILKEEVTKMSNILCMCVWNIEIGLEQAPFVFFNLFFSAFEHVKSLLIMVPNNTKNSLLKCDFHIINYE